MKEHIRLATSRLNVKVRCAHCQAEIRYQAKQPTEAEFNAYLWQGIAALWQLAKTWHLFALFAVATMISFVFSLTVHIIFLISHGKSWILIVLLIISYCSELMPTPRALASLPRVTLFEASSGAYQAEAIDVANGLRIFLSMTLHTLGLIFYIAIPLIEEHYVSFIWPLIDLVALTIWTWHGKRWIFNHWSQLNAHVELGEKTPV